MEINFTIKQVNLIQELIKEGFKIKNYNGINFIQLVKGSLLVDIENF